MTERGLIKEAMRVHLQGDAAPDLEQEAPVALHARGLRKLLPPPRRAFHAPEPPAAVLDDVTLTLHRGETLTILGEPGSGKRLLARLLTRGTEADAGSIYLDPPHHLLTLLATLTRYCDLEDRLTQVETGVLASAAARLAALLAEEPPAPNGLSPDEQKGLRKHRRAAEHLQRDTAHALHRATAAAAKAAEQVRPRLAAAKQGVEAHTDYLRDYILARREVTVALKQAEREAHDAIAAAVARFRDATTGLPLPDAHPTPAAVAALLESLPKVTAWSSLLDDEALAPLRDELRKLEGEIMPLLRPVRRDIVDGYLDAIDVKYAFSRIEPGRHLRHAEHRIRILHDPATDPALKGRATVARVVRHAEREAHLGLHGDARERNLRDALADAGLPGDEAALNRRVQDLTPHERFQLGLAAALVANPSVLILDLAPGVLATPEGTEVLTILRTARDRRRLALLHLTTDPAEASRVADRVAILQQGRIVEEGSARGVLDTPVHPYTRALLPASAPAAPAAPAAPPAPPLRAPTGCRHHAGCPYAEARCHERAPEPVALPARARSVRCHFAHALAEGTRKPTRAT